MRHPPARNVQGEGLRAAARLSRRVARREERRGRVLMDLQLAGKTALVTGASAGIGRAIATELGKEGVKLIITGRRAAELETLAQEIAATGGLPPPIVAPHPMHASHAAAIL